MTDRTASRSDARKRRLERDMADAHATARERDAQATPSEVTAKVRAFWAEIAAAVKPLTAHYTYDPARDQVIDNLTGEITRLSKEDTLTAKARHDELNALLNKISEESVSTSNVLADVLDLLRERLPERTEVKVAPFDPDLAARNLDALKHAVSKPMSEHGECCEPAPADDLPGDRRVNVTITDVYAVPDEHGFLRINVGPEGATVDPDARNVTVTDVSDAPADDLPGEPVEPGDLRAGDRVEFTLMGERIACTLVSSSLGDLLYSDAPLSSGLLPNVVESGEWRDGISDVRLIERAPREDEARERVGLPVDTGPRIVCGVCGARPDSLLGHVDCAPDVDPDEALAKVIFKAFSGSSGREVDDTGPGWRAVARAAREHIEAEQESLERTVVDEWDDMLARAEKAEAERDEWKARHEALREDVETRWAFVDDNFLKDILHSILKGDDERAKGGQR